MQKAVSAQLVRKVFEVKEPEKMKFLPTALAIAVSCGLLAAEPAQADEALTKKHNCLARHQIDKKSVGPSYKDIAKKYKGQAGIKAKLAEKVKKGGSGVWGPVPMAPNPAVPEGDIKKLVQWVLKLG